MCTVSHLSRSTGSRLFSGKVKLLHVNRFEVLRGEAGLPTPPLLVFRLCDGGRAKVGELFDVCNGTFRLI